jgi:Tfp pilus assembly protein FimT
MELILVLVIISTMLALAAPSLRGFWTGARARDAATEVQSLARYARTQAAAEGRVYRLNVDAASGVCRVEVQEYGQFVELSSSLGRSYALPAEVRAEVAAHGEAGQVQGAGQGQTAINFYPNGRSDPALIRLTDTLGQTSFVGSLAPAEPYRLLTSEEVGSL